MRAMIDAVRYLAHAYGKTSKPIMPFACLVILVGLLYAVMPVLPADSYAASATILCFVATWIGLTYADVEDPVSEQLLVLKLGSMARYQAVYTLFLACVGLLAAALAVLQPILVNIVNSGALYSEQLTLQTVLFGLLLHACAGFMGTATGAFFHPRLFADRKIALLLASTTLIIGFVRIGLHNTLPWTRYLTWLFPPVSLISERLAGTGTFAPGAVLAVCGVCALYGGALTLLRAAILCRKRFS